MSEEEGEFPNPEIVTVGDDIAMMLGKTEDGRRRGQQRMRWLDGIMQLNGHEFEQTQGDSEG